MCCFVGTGRLVEWLQLLMVVLSTPWNGTSDNFWVGFGYFLVSQMLGLHD